MRKPLVRFACAAVAIALGVFLSRGVLETYRDQRARTDKSLAEMRSSEAGRAKLTRDKMALDTVPGQEALVRSRGYVQHGEQPLSDAR